MDSCFLCEGKFAVHETRSLLIYDNCSRPLVMGIKYGGRTHLAYMLGKLMNKVMAEFVGNYQVVCPVPLHVKRLRRRLYNQATILSFGVDLPTKNLLERHRHVTTQKNLTRKQREKNVKNSFRARSDSIRDKNILLIDDLLTTGATANSCAKELLKQGANKVGLITLCRTV